MYTWVMYVYTHIHAYVRMRTSVCMLFLQSIWLSLSSARSVQYGEFLACLTRQNVSLLVLLRLQVA